MSNSLASPASRFPLQEKSSNTMPDPRFSYSSRIIDTPVSYKKDSKFTTPPESVHHVSNRTTTSTMPETPVSKHAATKTSHPSNNNPNDASTSAYPSDKNYETALLSPAFSSPQRSTYFQHSSYAAPHYLAIPPPKPSFADTEDHPSSSISLSSAVNNDSHLSSEPPSVPDTAKPTTTAPKKRQKKPKELQTSGFSIESDEKPPYSYATLIGMSILTTLDRKLTLSSIYQWISDTFKYYKREDVGWQNSIRHNLSLNKAFIKGDKSKDGKGHYWCIKPGCEQQFLKSRNNKMSGYHEVMHQLKNYPDHPNYPVHHFGIPTSPITNRPNPTSQSDQHHRSINSIPSSPNFGTDDSSARDSLTAVTNKKRTHATMSYESLSNDEETPASDGNNGTSTDHQAEVDDLDQCDFNHKYGRTILDNPVSLKKHKFQQHPEDLSLSWQATSPDSPNDTLVSTPKTTKYCHNDDNPHFVISESPNKPLLAGKNLTYTSSFSCNSNLELSPIRPNETGPLLEPLTPANNNQRQTANYQFPLSTVSHLHPHSNPYSLSQYHLAGSAQQTTLAPSTTEKTAPPTLPQASTTNSHSLPMPNLLRTPKSASTRTPSRILKTPQTASIMKKLWHSPSYLDDFYYSPLVTSSQGALNSYDDDDMIMRAFESPAASSANHQHKRSAVTQLRKSFNSTSSSMDSSRNLFNDLKKIDSLSSASSVTLSSFGSENDSKDTKGSGSSKSNATVSDADN